MRAIAAGAGTASELARCLDVSKLAAANTILALQERGYLERYSDPVDAHRMVVKLTSRGYEAMRVGERIMDELREEWARGPHSA